MIADRSGRFIGRACAQRRGGSCAGRGGCAGARTARACNGTWSSNRDRGISHGRNARRIARHRLRVARDCTRACCRSRHGDSNRAEYVHINRCSRNRHNGEREARRQRREIAIIRGARCPCCAAKLIESDCHHARPDVCVPEVIAGDLSGDYSGASVALAFQWEATSCHLRRA